MSWQGQLPDDVGFEPLPRWMSRFRPHLRLVTGFAHLRSCVTEVVGFLQKILPSLARRITEASTLTTKNGVFLDSKVSFGFDVPQNCAAF